MQYTRRGRIQKTLSDRSRVKYLCSRLIRELGSVATSRINIPGFAYAMGCCDIWQPTSDALYYVEEPYSADGTLCRYRLANVFIRHKDCIAVTFQQYAPLEASLNDVGDYAAICRLKFLTIEDMEKKFVDPEFRAKYGYAPDGTIVPYWYSQPLGDQPDMLREVGMYDIAHKDLTDTNPANVLRTAPFIHLANYTMGGHRIHQWYRTRSRDAITKRCYKLLMVPRPYLSCISTVRPLNYGV